MSLVGSLVWIELSLSLVRELSCEGDLGLDLPYTATKRIDQTLEEFYPCEWSE